MSTTEKAIAKSTWNEVERLIGFLPRRDAGLRGQGRLPQALPGTRALRLYLESSHSAQDTSSNESAWAIQHFPCLNPWLSLKPALKTLDIPLTLSPFRLP